ncbi:MAG: TlpA family protein disulfide reductase [Gemmatimonadetes bacterium]|nr:MAG: TlpA family protein disulfide reductase [Gemmatimonadota bacterium]
MSARMGRRVSSAVAAVAAIGLLTAAGCVEPELAARVGAPVPEFEAVTLTDGRPVGPADFEGEVTLINLWATWCGPCRHETPYLQSVYETYGPRGLRIVGVSVDSPGARRAAIDFMDENGVTYDRWFDPDGTGTGVFAAIGLPASFLVGRDGTLRWIRYGPILEGDRDFLGALERALGDGPPEGAPDPPDRENPESPPLP